MCHLLVVFLVVLITWIYKRSIPLISYLGKTSFPSMSCSIVKSPTCTKWVNVSIHVSSHKSGVARENIFYLVNNHSLSHLLLLQTLHLGWKNIARWFHLELHHRQIPCLVKLCLVFSHGMLSYILTADEKSNAASNFEFSVRARIRATLYIFSGL